MMKSLNYFIFAFAVVLINATTVLAGPRCAQITEFKKEYVNLINQLKTQNNKLEVDASGKIKAMANTSGDEFNSSGKELQEELRKHYQNALIKVAKYYKEIKSDPNFKIDELSKTNPKVAEFFKKIDPDLTPKLEGGGAGKQDNNLLLEEFLNKINSSGKVVLSDNDKYFLKKLITHSQDQICRMERSKAEQVSSTDFSEITGDYIINSIREMSKKDDLKEFSVKAAIDQSIKASLEKMQNILKDPSCRDSLWGNLSSGNIKNLYGSELNIQACNYNKFLDALTRGQVKEFEALLHFMNANKKSHTSFTALGVELLAGSPSKSTPSVSCSKSDNGLLVKNFPTDDKSKINCKVGSEGKSGEDCFKLLTVTLVENNEHRVTPNEGSNLSEFSIAGGAECTFAINKQPEPPKDPPSEPKKDENLPPPNKESCTQQECNSLGENYQKYYNRGIAWENNQCIGKNDSDKKELTQTVICKINEPAQPQNPTPNQNTGENTDKAKEDCLKKNPSGEETPRIRYEWNEKEKKCIDKDANKGEAAPVEKEGEDANSSGATNSTPQAPPARFVPVNIPQRMPYILPGMP